MINWTIVASFPLPLEANLAKGKLQSEGITSIIRDELTVQSDYLLSNAIGGVKVLVHKKDHERAKSILIEAGYIQLSTSEKPSWFDNATAALPLVGKMQIEYRFVILGCMIIFPVVLLLYWSFHPSQSERLVRSNWCITSVVFDGKEINLDDIPDIKSYIELVYVDDITPFCNLAISFRDGQHIGRTSGITLPGLNSSRWYLSEDSLIITDWYEVFYSANFEQQDSTHRLGSDSLSRLIVDRSYQLEFGSRSLVLHSKGLTIMCRENFQFY